MYVRLLLAMNITKDNINQEIKASAILETHKIFAHLSRDLIDDEIQNILLFDIFHQDDEVAKSAINLIKIFDIKKGYNSLLKVIQEYEDERRILALKAIGEIGDEKLVKPLYELFMASFDEEVKINILKILAKYGKENPEIVELITSYSDEEIETNPLKLAAIECLVHIEQYEPIKNILFRSDDKKAISAVIDSLKGQKNREVINIVNKIHNSFAKYPKKIQIEIFYLMVSIESTMALDIAKKFVHSEDEEYIYALLDAIVNKPFFKGASRSVIRIFKRISVFDDQMEQRIKDSFSIYYDYFEENAPKEAQLIMTEIEKEIRSFIQKMDIKPKGGKVKTQIEKDFDYAISFLEMYANKELIDNLTTMLKQRKIDKENGLSKHTLKKLSEIAMTVYDEYEDNIKSLYKIIGNDDYHARYRMASLLQSIDLERRIHYKKLSRLLYFVSVTKNRGCSDFAYEIYKWGESLKNKELMITSLLAMARTQNKNILKEGLSMLIKAKEKKTIINCVRAIGEYGQTDGNDILVKFLEHHGIKTLDDDIIIEILVSINKIDPKKDYKIVNYLVKIFLEKKDSNSVIYKCALVIANLSTSKILGALSKYINTDNENIKKNIVLIAGKIYERLEGKESKLVFQNFVYSVLKTHYITDDIKIACINVLYKIGDEYYLKLFKSLLSATDVNNLPDVIQDTIEIDDLDRLLILINLLSLDNIEIQQAVSMSLLSLINAGSSHIPNIVKLLKEFRLRSVSQEQVKSLENNKYVRIKIKSEQEK